MGQSALGINILPQGGATQDQNSAHAGKRPRTTNLVTDILVKTKEEVLKMEVKRV